MKSRLFPKSRFGKWTVGLISFSILAFILLYIFAELFDVIPFDILRILGATTVIASIVTFFTGIIAILKNKDRTVLVILSSIVGFAVLSTIIVSMLDDLLIYTFSCVCNHPDHGLMVCPNTAG